jgi:hypothetical protein
VKARSILPPSIWRCAYTVAYRPRPYTWLPVGTSHRFHLLSTYRPAPLFGGVPYINVTGPRVRAVVSQMIRFDRQQAREAARIAKRKAEAEARAWRAKRRKNKPRRVWMPREPQPKKPRLMIPLNPGVLHESVLIAGKAVGVDPCEAFARKPSGNFNRYPENIEARLKVYLHMRIEMRMGYPQIAAACGMTSHAGVVEAVNAAMDGGRVTEGQAATLRELCVRGLKRAL